MDAADETAAAAHIALARRFIAAVEAGDIDTVRSIYSPDARIWHNDDGLEQTVDQNAGVLSWLAQKLPDRHYVIHRLEALPDGYVQQHVLHGDLPGGGTWSMPACLVVRIEDGRIVRLDEYLDSAKVGELLTALGIT